MRIAVDKLLKEPGATLSRVFRPKAEELAYEGLEFTNSPIRVTVELQNAGNTIIGRLQVECEFALECSRCVERCGFGVVASRQIEYLQNPTPEALEAELDGWFVTQFDGETVELDEDVRQMLILAMPMKFVCSEDCRGLCLRCGKNLNTGACSCPPSSGGTAVDNPFRSALNDLFRKKNLQGE